MGKRTIPFYFHAVKKDVQDSDITKKGMMHKLDNCICFGTARTHPISQILKACPDSEGNIILPIDKPNSLLYELPTNISNIESKH
jgi:hypothetical protein